MAEVLKNDGSLPATKTSAADIRSAVETANAEDESRKQDDDDTSDDDDSGDDAGSQGTGGEDDSDQGDDDSDTDDGDDDDSGDDDSKSDKQSKSRRFTQFAGDGSDEAYLSNLEKGYLNTSKEAVRLNSELETAQGRVDAIMRAAATDADLASKLNAVLKGQQVPGGTGTDPNSDASVEDDADNPFVRNLQAEWTEKSEKEIDDFIEANPEVVTDPKIKGDVQYWMKQFSNAHFKRTGRLMSGGEAMAAAYRHLGLENKLEKQNLADGAKKNAAPARQRSKAKKATGQKPAFTDAQIAMAKSMGKDLAWLEKNAK